MDRETGTATAAENTTAAPTTQPVCATTSHTLEFSWYVLSLELRIIKGKLDRSLKTVSVTAFPPAGGAQTPPKQVLKFDTDS